MAKKKNPEEGTIIGERLRDAMAKKGITPLQLKEKLKSRPTYEHIRTIVNGEKFPGRPLLAEISATLNINAKEMAEVAEMDRARIKYGWLIAKLAGKTTDPDLAIIERAWETMSAAHRQSIRALSQAYADADALRGRQ